MNCPGKLSKYWIGWKILWKVLEQTEIKLYKANSHKRTEKLSEFWNSVSFVCTDNAWKAAKNFEFGWKLFGFNLWIFLKILNLCELKCSACSFTLFGVNSIWYNSSLVNVLLAFYTLTNKIIQTAFDRGIWGNVYLGFDV